MKTISILALVIIAAAVGYAGAQWQNNRAAEVGRPGGTVDLSAPTPRLYGKPNLSGLWQAERTPTSEFVRVLGPGLPEIQPDLNEVTKHVINLFWDVKPEDLPLKPEAAALTEERQKSGRDFQSAYCLPSSLPAATLVLNVKMVQAPGEIVVLHGNGDPARQIYIDGRKLPENPEPSWMGTSAGHWEDDVLVVETTGFNERAWLDGFGHPRSETMRVTERFRRRDFGHMDIEVTLSDPAAYARPWTVPLKAELTPDTELLESVCNEGPSQREHWIGKASDDLKSSVQVAPALLAKYAGTYQELDNWGPGPQLSSSW